MAFVFTRKTWTIYTHRYIGRKERRKYGSKQTKKEYFQTKRKYLS
jgi:hypothetical protein